MSIRKPKKRVTKIVETLNLLNKEDIYSLMLFTLYKMKDIPDYLTLTELSYILDGDSLNKLLKYFGGMTITIPTPKQFDLVFQTLLLYQYINLEEGEFESGLKAVVKDDADKDEVRLLYVKLVEVLSNYEFNVR